jgi:hypothetical protein
VVSVLVADATARLMRQIRLDSHAGHRTSGL